MANQQDAGKMDPLTGMAHSEAHYFNRFAFGGYQKKGTTANHYAMHIVTTIMVSFQISLSEDVC